MVWWAGPAPADGAGKAVVRGNRCEPSLATPLIKDCAFLN
ncbi:hypothetical protein NY78_2224 [Desulfovibrio sp. TomC]|nr:hypothetical protein NY78_2224 [Desulfovibrio sp. TomC]